MKPHPDEVDAVKWVTLEEMDTMMDDDGEQLWKLLQLLQARENHCCFISPLVCNDEMHAIMYIVELSYFCAVAGDAQIVDLRQMKTLTQGRNVRSPEHSIKRTHRW